VAIDEEHAPPGRQRSERGPKPFFPNRSPRDRALPQVFETQQHGEHPFELAVQVGLVAANETERASPLCPRATGRSVEPSEQIDGTQ
jgi:hypothetical protein